jgi:hypothetical protein
MSTNPQPKQKQQTECAGGYAGSSCAKCASTDVAKPGKPGKQTCG